MSSRVGSRGIRRRRGKSEEGSIGIKYDDC